MRSLARRFGLGKAAYYLWHLPKGAVTNLIAAGSPVEQWRAGRGRREMEAAAHSLPLLPATQGESLEVHLLTGRKCWYQTAFCLWTLARRADRPLLPVLYDDGTLSSQILEPLQRLFPAMRYITQSTKLTELDQCLPESRYPFLRERWRNYPNIRKLIDPHAGQAGWKLVLDSDLLFFQRPSLLIDWIDRPERPLHAVDCETSYGYSRALMAELAGAPIADRVNVGLTGLDGAALDWDRIEYFCRELIQRERTSYYLEQALIAMLVAGKACIVAPETDYVTLPVAPEARECTAVMHHYVASSKKWYFGYNWQRVLTSG